MFRTIPFTGGEMFLTRREKEVKKCLTENYLTVQQTARLLNISDRRVRQIRIQLKNKGALGAIPTIPNLEQTSEGRRNVHGMRVRIKILFPYDGLKSGNVHLTDFGGVDVQVAGKYIFCRSSGLRWFAESEEKALWNAMDFWVSFMRKLENRLDCVLSKVGYTDLKIVYYEWETEDSVVSRDADRRGVIWRVYHSEDGKLRLSVDRSLGAHNHETHHRRDAMSDSVVFNSQINAILDNPSCPTLPELSRVIGVLAQQNGDTAAGLNAVVKLMKPPEREDFPVPFERPSYVG